MRLFNKTTYTEALTKHYERYFGVNGRLSKHDRGPVEKLHKDFSVLEIPPNKAHNMYCYCTVGMSADRVDGNLVELFVYSPRATNGMVELMTMCASYHKDRDPLNLNHTVKLGQGWLDDSICDHGFISLPYLDGEELELLSFGGRTVHCYWFIPITETERDYKITHGAERLEQLFEDKGLDYLNPARRSLI